MPTAPHGKHWVMGLGLLCLLAGLVFVDLCFLFLLMGKASLLTLLTMQIAAAVLVFVALMLLRSGARMRNGPEPARSVSQ